MKKEQIAIYARVSSSQQKEAATIESQVDVLFKYAQDNGFEIPAEWIFKDDGYSGSVLDRPGLDELRDLVREGVIGAILVYSPDRLSRKYVSQLILEEEFRKHNVKTIYIKGSKNETPEERLLQHFQGIFAEYERTQILDRSRRGRLYKARQGDKRVLPKAPYGYINSRDDFYSIDPQQALVVKQIFHLYTKAGYSLRAIGRYLTEKSITSPSGNSKWSATTIMEMLRNSAYIGTAHYGKTEKGEGDNTRIARYKKIGKVVKAKGPKRDRPKESWYPISVASIISESDFEAAQELLKRNKELSSRNTKQPSILQGLLVCGCCGCTFYKRIYSRGKVNRAKYYCKSQLSKELRWCGNKSLNQEHLDELVWGEVIKLLEDPRLIEEEIKRRVDDTPKKQEIDNRERELKQEELKIKNAQDKLLEAFQEEDCLTLPQLKERMQKLKARAKELKKELESLQALSILNEKRASLSMTIEQFRMHIDKNAKNLTIQKKQQIARSLIEEIVITSGEIMVHHTIPLDSEQKSLLCSVYVS